MSADRQQQDANDKATQESDTKAGSLLATCPLKAQTVKIVPVRYALDEFQLVPEPCPKHNLPSEGNFPGGYFNKQLKCNSYTLRQLTDGWLYVWNQTEKTLHEYEVRGPQLIRYQFGDNEADKPLSERGTALEPKVYLEYNRGSELYLMFSQLRCSWPMLEHYRSNGEAQRRWGRKLSLPGFCRTMAEPHTAPIKVLSQVADIAGEAKFPLAVPSLQDRGEGDEKISGKPVQPLTTYLGPISDKDSALMVALDDIWSDIDDILSQTAYIAGQMHEFNEDEMYRRMNGQAVIQLCGAGDMLSMEGWMHDDKLPSKVRGNKLAISRYLDKVSDYAYEKEQWNIAVQRASRKLNDSFELPSSETYKRLEKEIIEEYGRVPVIPKEWEKNKKRRQYADLQAAESFLNEHLQHDKELISEVELRLEEAFSCHFAIPADASVLGADCHHVEHQLALTNWIGNTYEILLPFMDEPQRAQLRNALWDSDKAAALIALSYSGFDPELHAALYNIQQKLPREAEKAQSEEVSEANNYMGRVNEWLAAFDELRLADDGWVRMLRDEIQLTLTTMQKAFGTMSSIGWDQLMKALFPLIGKEGSKSLSRVKMVRMNVLSSFIYNLPFDKSSFKEYLNKKEQWDRKYFEINKRIEDSQKALSTPGKTKRDYKAHSNSIAKNQQKLERLNTKIPEMLRLKHNGIMEVYRQNLSNVMRDMVNGGKRFGGDIISGVKSGVGYTVVLMNLWNVLETPMPSSMETSDILGNGDSDGLDGREKLSRVWISNVSYLAAAATSIWYGISVKNLNDVVEKGIHNISTSVVQGVRRTNVPLLRQSIQEVKALGGSELSKTVSAFKSSARLLGGLMVIATAYEFSVVTDELDQWRKGKSDLNFIELQLTTVKAVSLSVQLAGGAYIFFQSFGIGVAIPGFGIIMAITGLIYLLSSLMLTWWSRDDVDKWLEGSSFGQKTKWQLDPKLEFQELMDALLKPSVYARTCFTIEADEGESIEYDVEGCWLVLTLPQANLSVSVAEVKKSLVFWNSQVENENLGDITPIHLSDAAMQQILTKGLPNRLDNELNIDLSPPKGMGIHWLVPIAMKESYSEIWLSVQRYDLTNIAKEWCFEIDPQDIGNIYNGKTIKPAANGSFAWPSGATPVMLNMKNIME
ncbi:toxin VasX [Shewanella algae]|uniref:toxin VasX n=1 Tax=Shewanella algae TaxID=38313 RepID=UPI0031F581C0